MSSKVVVIGGGPGGYVAAIRAAQLNSEVVLIEKDELGGTCLNRGCIPTKTLLESADTFWKVKEQGAALGISTPGVFLDFSAVNKRKQNTVKQLVSGVEFLLNKNKVSVVRGVATIIDPRTVKVAGRDEEIRADSIVIATGSVPSTISVPGIDSEGVMDSDEFLNLEQIPGSVAIIGGGVVGIEFAQIMHRMGAAVTVIEMMPQILPNEDLELAQMLESILKREGIEVFTNATVSEIKATEDGSKAVLFSTQDSSGERVAEKVLIAVGRNPAVNGLGLEKLGINLNENQIVVDEKMQTNVPGVYAVGDVVGGVRLAHVASAEGKCAVENIAGIDASMNYRVVPRCIYTSPEVACVGLTEAQAKEKYNDVIVGRFPLAGNSKAVITGETNGLVKVIAESRYGEVIGVETLAPHATELIAEAVLGMRLEATVDDFASAVHAHPTVSEAIMEAALNVKGKAIHI